MNFFFTNTLYRKIWHTDEKDGLSIIILSNALALYSKKVFFLVLVKHGTQTD